MPFEMKLFEKIYTNNEYIIAQIDFVLVNKIMTDLSILQTSLPVTFLLEMGFIYLR